MYYISIDPHTITIFRKKRYPVSILEAKTSETPKHQSTNVHTVYKKVSSKRGRNKPTKRNNHLEYNIKGVNKEGGKTPKERASKASKIIPTHPKTARKNGKPRT